MTRLHKLRAGQLLREVGLHPAQELVMMQLWDSGRQRQTDLVRQLGSDAATMTRTIQRLENAGFVRRLPCDDDKRVTLVESTEAGSALRPRVDALWSELEADTVRGLSPAERTLFLGLLNRTETTLATAVDTAGASTTDRK
ncbi:MarR family transcriptional regulator [Herbiconiux sp. VKM Ac-1786]|nr:MarR family transcriptional regulator [Herbiconiux sp. VKM Ac-1786]